LRKRIDEWRRLPNPIDWKVTPETARLLQHWRHFDFRGDASNVHLFGQLKRVTRQWLDGFLECKGGTPPAQLIDARFEN
jgi:hypothetical protein